MKRLTAILLAMLMVAFCCATTAMADDASTDAASTDAVSTDAASTDAASTDAASTDAASTDAASTDAASTDATSEEAAPSANNIVAGKTYSIVADDGDAAYNGSYDDGMGEGFYLTDGIVRDVEQLTASGVGDMDKTLELAGTSRTHFVTIQFGGAYDLSSVVLGTVRRGHNRYTNLASIEALVGGVWTTVAFTENAVFIEGSQQYGDESQGIAPYDQFFNVEAAVDVKGATAIRVGLNTLRADGTRGYIVQLDEIEVYGVTGTGVGGGSTSTPSAGDLGLGVFAVLAVVSLAGVVVAKKVK